MREVVVVVVVEKSADVRRRRRSLAVEVVVVEKATEARRQWCHAWMGKLLALLSISWVTHLRTDKQCPSRL